MTDKNNVQVKLSFPHLAMRDTEKERDRFLCPHLVREKGGKGRWYCANPMWSVSGATKEEAFSSYHKQLEQRYAILQTIITRRSS